jgi:hypothetical protein
MAPSSLMVSIGLLLDEFPATKPIMPPDVHAPNSNLSTFASTPAYETDLRPKGLYGPPTKLEWGQKGEDHMKKTLIIGLAMGTAAISSADIEFVNNPYDNASPDIHYHGVIGTGGFNYTPVSDNSTFNGAYSAGSNQITLSASEQQVVTFAKEVNSDFGVLDFYNVYFYSTTDVRMTSIDLKAPMVDFGNQARGKFQGNAGMSSYTGFSASVTTEPNITAGLGLGSDLFNSPTYGDFTQGGEWVGGNGIPNGNSFFCTAGTVYTAQLTVDAQLNKLYGETPSTYYEFADGFSVNGDPTTSPVTATFSFQAVPEPSPLLVFGAAPLMFLRKRRKG